MHCSHLPNRTSSDYNLWQSPYLSCTRSKVNNEEMQEIKWRGRTIDRWIIDFDSRSRDQLWRPGASIEISKEAKVCLVNFSRTWCWLHICKSGKHPNGTWASMIHNICSFASFPEPKLIRWENLWQNGRNRSRKQGGFWDDEDQQLVEQQLEEVGETLEDWEQPMIKEIPKNITYTFHQSSSKTLHQKLALNKSHIFRSNEVQSVYRIGIGSDGLETLHKNVHMIWQGETADIGEAHQ